MFINLGVKLQEGMKTKEAVAQMHFYWPEIIVFTSIKQIDQVCV